MIFESVNKVVAVFQIKPPGAGSHRVGAAPDVNAVALGGQFFNGSPVGLGFGAFIHAVFLAIITGLRKLRQINLQINIHGAPGFLISGFRFHLLRLLRFFAAVRVLLAKVSAFSQKTPCRIIFPFL